MWSYEHSIETTATAEAIWQLYSDVRTWPEWDEGIAEVTIDGPFVTGATGTLTPTGQDPLPYRMVDAREREGFTDITEIPGAGVTLRFTHTLTPLPDSGTRITHRVEISGPAADELGPEIGPGITSDMPHTMATLARRAAETTR